MGIADERPRGNVTKAPSTLRIHGLASPVMTNRPAFNDAVLAVIVAIPRGEVMSYGEVAEEAGFPGAARAVGNVLRTVPGLPWWRVVTASGRLVPDSEQEHAQRLRSEGVTVREGHVHRP
jgi:methylated-DNA-protein-cysteine methyltransferase-like protein